MAILAYFRSPFPSREGFSAYRSPGGTVHWPLIFAAICVGFGLCWPHLPLRPLLIVWVAAGLYLGRDLAILCHYNPLLSAVCWALSLWALMKPLPIARFGAAHPLASVALTALAGGVLWFAAWWMTRGDGSAGQAK